MYREVGARRFRRLRRAPEPDREAAAASVLQRQIRFSFRQSRQSDYRISRHRVSFVVVIAAVVVIVGAVVVVVVRLCRVLCVATVCSPKIMVLKQT